MASHRLFATRALLPDGWASDVLLEIGADGTLAAVTPGSAPPAGAQRASGPLLPGMPNLHSHAFQRAMAGLAERAGQEGTPGEADSFWTWRQAMYGFVGRLTPAQNEAIAAQLYVEMLKAGYTAVGEFHYLHHDPDGRPYADPAEMAERIAAAAAVAGIGLTLLPVLYAQGGFGGQPTGPGQRRFRHDADSFLRLVELLWSRHRGDPQLRLGIAPHSLRAVTPAQLAAAVAGLHRLDPTAPVHIHIAEQVKEVEDCLAWSGARPVDWLLDQAGPDARWCLVHATHMTDGETARLAASGAVAGLCPTTEANLGDGLFNAPGYLARGGRWGIGSDSHISVSPIEELRWLEYGQRLLHRRRNLLLPGNRAGGNVGAALYRAALEGGARALGRPIGRLAPGARADLLVLDTERPSLLGRANDALLDAVVFAGNENPVRDVMVGGRWVVEQGRHVAEAGVLDAYRRALAELRWLMSEIHFTYLNGPDIARLALDDHEILDAVEAGLRAQGLGQAVIEPRVHLEPDPAFKGHFNVLRGYLAPQRLAGVKIVGDYVENWRRGLPSEMALLNLFDPETGMPVALLDATLITEMRTGALTALGARYLARRDSRILGHVGARGTAYWNVRLLDRLFDFAEIRVHSQRPDSRDAFARRLSQDLGKKVVATADWQSCLDDADILVEATRLERPTPLLRTAWVKPGALVVPYGTMSAVELDLTDIMDKLVVDDWGQCRAGKFGALRAHVEAGKLSEATLHAELCQIVTGTRPGRERPDETILFWHRGLSLSDIALGHAMLEKARRLGIGQQLRYA